MRVAGSGYARSALGRNEWLATSMRPRLRPGTIATYEGTANRYLRRYLGHIAVAKLTPADVAGMMPALARTELSATTRRYPFVVLRAALTHALRAGYVTRNVAALTDLPHRDKVEPAPLPIEQVARLLIETTDEPIGPLLALCATTGLRQGGALGLTWPSVDLDAGAFTVRHTFDLATRELAPTKTDRRRRTIHLPKAALTALREQRRRQVEMGLAGGRRCRVQDLVFTTPIGTALDASKVLRSYHAAAIRAGLPHRPSHHLRHLPPRRCSRPARICTP